MTTREITVRLAQGRSIDAYLRTQVVGLQSKVDEVQPLPDELAEWLGRLRLLYGVPFEYLVPEERLLPKESIRFFYLDRNWVDRLVDGALSIGKLGTRDYRQHEGQEGSIQQSLAFAEINMRKALRGEGLDPSMEVAAGGTVTGVFVRSTIIADYPGVEIRAYGQKASVVSKQKLTLLRMDRLAPDILFCLFHGVPKSMELEEPREGIQFGVEEGDLYRPRTDTGSYVDDEAVRSVPMKDESDVGGRRVIDIAKFAKEFDNDPATTLNSSEVAIQLLQFPYLQQFDEGGTCAGVTSDSDTDPLWGSIDFGLFQAHTVPRVVGEGVQESLQQSFEVVLGDVVDLDVIFK